MAVFVTPKAHAAQTIPYKINFQGRLTDNTGSPVADGLYNIKFRIFDAASGGSQQWAETRETTNRVQITNGLFSVQLGDVTALTNIFTTQNLYFEVELPTPATATCSTASCASFTEGAMTPRSKLGASAYAFNADTVDGIDGASIGQLGANNTWTGTNLVKLDSTTAFHVQNSSSVDLFKVDTATVQVTIGASTTITAGNSLTIVGSGARPTGAEGMIYYDTATKQLLVYSNGKWQADRSAAILVAASDSAQAAKDAADYVADGTDDQVQINDALSNANPGGSGRKNGQVYLFAGTYVVHQTDNGDATIKIPNNTTLSGAGRGAVVRLGAIAGNENLIENSDTVTGTGVVIRNLLLDGQNGVSGTQNGIYLTAMGDVGSSRQGALVQNVWANDFRNSGIRLNDTDSSKVLGSTAQDNDSGIYIGSASNGNTVNGNYTQGNVYAIKMVTATSNAITDNNIVANNYGIHLLDSSNNTVSGNSANANTGSGVYLGYTSTGSNKNIVSGNNIHNNGSNDNNGIVIADSDDNTISSNSITDTTCPTTCYAISIINSAAQANKNYLSDNRFNTSSGTVTINDTGTGTVYANQSRAADGGQLLIRTTDDSQAFSIENASAVSLFVADTSNTLVKIGTTSSGTLSNVRLLSTSAEFTGTVRIGTATNGVDISGASGISLSGTARPTRTITLVPEFPGGVLTPDGSNNNGTMISDFCSHSTLLNINSTACGTSGDEHNYYQWTTTQGTAQDYDIYVRYRMPADYDTGSMANMRIWGWGTTTASEVVSMALYKGSATACGTITNAVTGDATWAESTVASPLGACSIAAGDLVTFKIGVTAGTSNIARVGEVRFEYRSKF